MAGYIGSKAVSVNTTSATITGDASIGGDLSLGDNDKIILGAGSDLQIYSDGTTSRIYESGSGLLTIRASNFNVNTADGSESYITMVDGGAVTSYHNGAAKIATAADGISVTGDVAITASDGAILNLQTSDTTVTDGSVLGAINFTAPSEGSGTDAILLGAAIEAVSEGTFAADNNATELVFKTGATAVADTKLTLSSGGRLQLNSKHQNAISNAQTAFDNAGFRINTFNGAGSNVGVSVGHTTPNIITIQGCYNEGSTAPLAINPYGGATTIGNGLTLTDGNLTVAAGHGIDFAAQTASSATGVSASKGELLDHYEQGAFTPIFSQDNGNQTNYGHAVGFYVRVGARVQAHGYLAVGDSLQSASGNVRLGGLPYPAVNITNGHTSVNIGWANSLNITAGQSLCGYLGPATDYMLLHLWDAATGATELQFSELSPGGQIMFFISYNAV